MERTMMPMMIAEIRESTSIAARIAIPDSHRIITVTYYSDERNALISFTFVTITGSEFSMVVFGDCFVNTITYIVKTISKEGEGKKDPETLWMKRIVPRLCFVYDAVKKYHV